MGWSQNKGCTVTCTTGSFGLIILLVVIIFIIVVVVFVFVVILIRVTLVAARRQRIHGGSALLQ